MAESTRELRIIALAQGRALHPQVFSSSFSPQCYLISPVLWSLLIFLNGRSVSSSHPIVLASARARVQYLTLISAPRRKEMHDWER